MTLTEHGKGCAMPLYALDFKVKTTGHWNALECQCAPAQLPTRQLPPKQLKAEPSEHTRNPERFVRSNEALLPLEATCRGTTV
jgi:hypothetical protein